MPLEEAGYGYEVGSSWESWQSDEVRGPYTVWLLRKCRKICTKSSKS